MAVLKNLSIKINIIVLFLLWLLPAHSETFLLKDLKGFNAYKTKQPKLRISAIAIPETIKPGEQFTLHIQVVIEPGFHIYSLEESFEEEPLATQIEFKSSNLHPISDWTESPPKQSLDLALGKTVKTHESLAQFNRDYTTKIPFLITDKKLSGNLFYRICDNKTCSLPLNEKFKVDLKIKKN